MNMDYVIMCKRIREMKEYRYALFGQRVYTLNHVYQWKERNTKDTEDLQFYVKEE
jgi:hypothetical protein